jgi:hypothetical protein
MKNVKFIPAILALGLVLAACGGAAEPEAAQPEYPTPESSAAGSTSSAPTEAVEAPLSTDQWADQSARQDDQGAIVVVVTPIELNAASSSIDFSVALDTHSIELSMDLAAMASLSTDTGFSVNGLSWDGMAGGHHVGGTLSFPALVDGVSILEGATSITLVFRDLDAQERSFSWSR